MIITAETLLNLKPQLVRCGAGFVWSWVCFLDHLTPFDSKERKNESPVEISYPDAHQLPNLNELSRMHRKMANPYRCILKDPARHPHRFPFPGILPIPEDPDHHSAQSRCPLAHARPSYSGGWRLLLLQERSAPQSSLGGFVLNEEADSRGEQTPQAGRHWGIQQTQRHSR